MTTIIKEQVPMRKIDYTSEKKTLGLPILERTNEY
jgi:hypothetical protein